MAGFCCVVLIVCTGFAGCMNGVAFVGGALVTCGLGACDTTTVGFVGAEIATGAGLTTTDGVGRVVVRGLAGD